MQEFAAAMQAQSLGPAQPAGSSTHWCVLTMPTSPPKHVSTQIWVEVHVHRPQRTPDATRVVHVPPSHLTSTPPIGAVLPSSAVIASESPSHGASDRRHVLAARSKLGSASRRMPCATSEPQPSSHAVASAHSPSLVHERSAAGTSTPPSVQSPASNG